MKVCDLPYSRYEVERAKEAFDVAIKKIKEAKSAEEVLAARKVLLDEMEELGTQVAEVAKDSSVYYVYTVENDTTIIISSDNERRFISYAVNDPEEILGTISAYFGTTAVVNLTAGDSLYIEVGTIDDASGNVEFEIAEPSDEVIDITGEYESISVTNPLTVIVDDETVTFICNRCKIEEDIDLDMVDEFGFDENEIPKLYCSHCSKGTMKPKYIISK